MNVELNANTVIQCHATEHHILTIKQAYIHTKSLKQVLRLLFVTLITSYNGWVLRRKSKFSELIHKDFH